MIQFFHLKRQKKGSNLLRKLQLKVTINPFSLLLHCIYLSFYWYQILLETDLKIGFSEWKPKFLHSMCKFQLDINLIVVIVLFQSECASKDTVPIRATWFALIQLLLPSLFLFYLLAKKSGQPLWSKKLQLDISLSASNYPENPVSTYAWHDDWLWFSPYINFQTSSRVANPYSSILN